MIADSRKPNKLRNIYTIRSTTMLIIDVKKDKKRSTDNLKLSKQITTLTVSLGNMQTQGSEGGKSFHDIYELKLHMIFIWPTE